MRSPGDLLSLIRDGVAVTRADLSTELLAAAGAAPAAVDRTLQTAA